MDFNHKSLISIVLQMKLDVDAKNERPNTSRH